MKTEYREQIDVKFKRKIETLVHKSAGSQLKTEDSSQVDATHTPCPYCDNEVIDTELLCDNCRNTIPLAIPFCIATGLHIVANDLTVCPNCQFPAILSQLLKILATEKTCPMCNTAINTSNIVRLEDAKQILDSNDKNVSILTQC